MSLLVSSSGETSTRTPDVQSSTWSQKGSRKSTERKGPLKHPTTQWSTQSPSESFRSHWSASTRGRYIPTSRTSRRSTPPQKPPLHRPGREDKTSRKSCETHYRRLMDRSSGSTGYKTS